MKQQLFHIFRNTPLGRETLFTSLYFCKKVGASLVIYIPEHTKFLMYFESDVVQVDLDSSYLTAPSTAKVHAAALTEQWDIKPRFFSPKQFTASTLPDIPTTFAYMCCPRSISDLSTKIGLGYIGPRVRRVVKSARFPVIVASPVFKEWKSIAVFFGGSSNAVKSLKLGFRIAGKTGMPLEIFTQVESNKSKADYEKVLKKEHLEKKAGEYITDWHFFEEGKFEENLYDVPHDALAIIGAYGHGVIKELLFGSFMEKIQSTISNNLLIVGPNYELWDDRLDIND